MADLITIGQLSALIGDQYRLLAHFEDHPEHLPAWDPVFPDDCRADIRVAGEPWSVQALRGAHECCHRDAGRVVVLAQGHPSPFDFHPQTLLRYVQSLDAETRLTDIVVDNWILKFVLAGRLARSPHRPGYYTCGG